MSPVDTARLAHLALSLNASPGQTLLAAARLTQARDPADLRRIVGEACETTAATERLVALLATPIASFAQDDVDRALASLWPRGN